MFKQTLGTIPMLKPRRLLLEAAPPATTVLWVPLQPSKYLAHWVHSEVSNTGCSHKIVRSVPQAIIVQLLACRLRLSVHKVSTAPLERHNLSRVLLAPMEMPPGLLTLKAALFARRATTVLRRVLRQQPSSAMPDTYAFPALNALSPLTL